MHLSFAHYRNRSCMFRTYYALANGLVQPDGFTLSVLEVPDPPSRAQAEMDMLVEMGELPRRHPISSLFLA